MADYVKSPDSSSIDEFKVFSQKFISKHTCTILATGPGTRSICGDHISLAIPCPELITAELEKASKTGSLDHTYAPEGQGKKYDERNGMINNFAGNLPFIHLLFNTFPGLEDLFAAVYGENFHIAMDRFWSRNNPLHVDTATKRGKERLAKNTHVDVPKWKKCPDASPTYSIIKIPQNHIGIIILSQSTPHSLPEAGNSYGIYIAGLREKDWINYTEKVVGLWKSMTQEKLKNQKAIYIWKKAAAALNSLSHLTANDIIATCFLFGIPAGIYPSTKKIQLPPTYSGAYKHYIGQISPNPGKQLVDPKPAIENMNPGYVKDLCAKIHALIPDEHWIVDPSKIADAFYARIFTQYQEDNCPPAKRQKLTLPEL